MEKWIEDPQWAGITAGAGLFLVALIALLIIAGLVSRGTKQASMLAPANRMLGVIFGILRGGVIVALVYIAAVHVIGLYEDEETEKAENPKWVESSRLMPHVRAAAAAIERLVPENMRPADRKKRQDSPRESTQL